MAQSTRMAYIRTTFCPDKDSQDTFALLNDYMRQTSFSDQVKGKQRHRFLFGAANASDAHILDLMIQQIPAKTQSDIGTPVAEPFPGRHSHMMDKNMCRADLELHISGNQASTLAGRKTLKRCKEQGIMTLISGTTEEESDKIMLEESHYFIDFLTPNLHYDHESWHRKCARSGQAQDNMLTNPTYDVSKLDASQWRLSRRYMGYGWQASSGGFHGNGKWMCKICSGTDGRCTRRKCVVGPSKEMEDALERSMTEKEKWVDECVRLPAKGDDEWTEMTAKEVCYRFRLRRFAGGKEDKRWKSVSTFSGE